MHGSVMVMGSHTVYVLMDDREAFDLIGVEVNDRSQKSPSYPVLTKAVEQGGVTVIFQYWLDRDEEKS